MSAPAEEALACNDSTAARDLLSLLNFLLLRAHKQDRWGRIRAWTWLLTMVSAAVVHGRAFIEFTVVQAGSINAVKDYDRQKFWQGRQKMFLVILKMVGSSSLQDFAAEKLKKIWRSALTTSMLHTYLDGTYYRAKLTGEVSNPDHRITTDVRSIVEDVTNLAKLLPEHVTNVVGLTGVMWKTSRFACTLLWSYVLAITMTTRRHFEKRTARLEIAMQDVEAHLRYALLHVHECAESIAFYGAARVEELRLSGMVCELATCWDRLLTFTSLFGSVERAVSWFASILPSMIMAPLFWTGSARFADYSQMVNGFRKVKDALFFLADNFDKLSSISARVERVRELRDFAEHSRKPLSLISMCGPAEGALLLLRTVRVAVPASRSGPVRWLGRGEGISASVAPGGTLLIQGESGVGKSSLLRAIAGLWDHGVGFIHRGREVFFLPQQPYIPAGPHSVATSIREQLLYPGTRAEDADLCSALEAVQLGHLAADLGQECDWATALSGGERQRLVFARLLVQLRGATAPLVLLDEATSACSEGAESQLYEALLQRAQHGAVISVGHRSSLRRFHQEVIVLEEDATGPL